LDHEAVMETALRPRREHSARALLVELIELRRAVAREGDELLESWRPALSRRAFLPSAVNLGHYIALRRRDVRPLQEQLMPLGLSSLGRCESRVLANLDAVIAALARFENSDEDAGIVAPRTGVFYRGNRLLRRHTDAVFGAPSAGRDVRIMVTLPAEAAEYGFVFDLVERGADVARVNCAHGSADEWAAMAGNVRRAARETGRTCRVMVDLEGPRARTGVVAGPQKDVFVAVGDRVRLLAARPDLAFGLPQIECSLPEAVAQLRAGHQLCIDEGRIRLVCEKPGRTSALLRVTQVESKGRIRGDKGLNFPDTALRLDPLTAKDLADLETVAAIADIVGYSFVQCAEDVTRLQDELRRVVPGKPLALAAKIETAVAVRNLPEIIVRGAGAQPFAVMIARGDLAVEIGFGRLAEIQEEILWLCEAAHIPVVWATQVLDSFVRKGSHSRAEMTDAAMAERAECVMLNKGPHILDALDVLDDVLGRMEAHQDKKTSRLRALHSW
jgi:pyruvate kinase